MRAFENVKKQIDEVERHNKQYDDEEASFKMRCNSRADLTVEEKQAFMNGLALTQQESENIKKHKLRVQSKANTVRQTSFPPAPLRLDYRELGYVTEVVDQGGNLPFECFFYVSWQILAIVGFYCSSCYAFSALGAVEAARVKKYGILEKLSDQQIIDCNKHPSTGNWGCDVRYEIYVSIIFWIICRREVGWERPLNISLAIEECKLLQLILCLTCNIRASSITREWKLL